MRFAPAPQPEGKALLQLMPAPGVLSALRRASAVYTAEERPGKQGAGAESSKYKGEQQQDQEEEEEQEEEEGVAAAGVVEERQLRMQASTEGAAEDEERMVGVKQGKGLGVTRRTRTYAKALMLV